MDRVLVKGDSIVSGDLGKIGSWGVILKHPRFDPGLIKLGEIGKVDGCT
jgi:hypothetical protein